MNDAIACEFRRTIFSERRDDRLFAAGMTVGEIVDAFDKPKEFAAFGAVILYNPDHHGLDEYGLPNGQWLDREHWHLIRPKAGTAIFISTVPHGGGGGGSGKSIFALVAAIALIALTVWVGGGGLSFLSPYLGVGLGAGTVGAHVTAAAIGCGGKVELDLLSSTTSAATRQNRAHVQRMIGLT